MMSGATEDVETAVAESERLAPREAAPRKPGRLRRRQLMVLAVLLIIGVIGAAFAYRGPTRRTKGQFFDSNGVRIHYTDEGKGEPVILVHGFAAHADINWRAPGITPMLARHYRVIALDNRGHGLSDKPHSPDAYGVEMVNDIVRLMDHLHIAKAHVIGYSMGGYITLKLITMYPERLISAAPCAAGWEPPEAGAPIREQIASSLELGNGFGPIIRLFAPGGKEPNPVRMWWTNRVLLRWNDPIALAHSLRAMSDLRVTEEQLRANQVPSLTIMGTDDPLRPGVDRMKGVMANHKIVFVAGKDHLTTLTSPLMKEALLTFLRENSGTTAASPEEEQHATRQELKPAA